MTTGKTTVLTRETVGKVMVAIEPKIKNIYMIYLRSIRMMLLNYSVGEDS